jgi:TetR/AcrR family transcriptional repressor of nem operon
MLKLDARTKLLNAAIETVRAQGYAATSVDELCRKAGVTKGAFFHHFESKDALAVAAANHWSETTGALFASAPYHAPNDPLDRVLAYVDFRREILQGTPAEFTCFVGTTVQESFATSDEIRAACKASIFGHAETLVADISEAMRKYTVKGDWTAQSLALHTQAVLQGAFILAKAAGNATVAADSVDHLRRYIELLFNRTPRGRSRRAPYGTTTTVTPSKPKLKAETPHRSNP